MGKQLMGRELQFCIAGVGMPLLGGEWIVGLGINRKGVATFSRRRPNHPTLREQQRREMRTYLRTV
jgi:hypothetical protein